MNFYRGYDPFAEVVPIKIGVCPYLIPKVFNLSGESFRIQKEEED